MQIHEWIDSLGISLTDLLPLSQNQNSRKATFQTLKDLFLGTTPLETTSQEVNGAINEVNTSLSDVAHKTGTIQTNLNADMIDGIQGNQIAQQTTADITYYVDPVNGLDTNNGLTSGTAFKSIMKAINSLPKIVNHNVIISRASGTTWENVNIMGFVGSGMITIVGASDATSASNYVVNSILVVNCNLSITIKGLAPSNGGLLYGISVYGCSNLTFYYINDTLSYNRNGIIVSTSLVNISESIISSKSIAIKSENNGTIVTVNNTGNANVNALYTVGGTIMQGGTQPSGTTQTLSYNGGVIR